MTAAKHTPPRDPSFRRSLARNTVGAVGLVVLVAAIFGVLGMIGRSDPDLDIADVPDEEPAAPVDETEEAADDETVASEEPVEEPEEPEEPPAEESEAPAEGPDEEPAEPETPPADPIDPATISVQVLDGFREDGGAAADAVFQELQEAGYRIVARNPALAYEVTTVFWTPGFEDEARQVAREIGATEVQEKPADSLSDQVNVHVVVGADRG